MKIKNLLFVLVLTLFSGYSWASGLDFKVGYWQADSMSDAIATIQHSEEFGIIQKSKANQSKSVAATKYATLYKSQLGKCSINSGFKQTGGGLYLAVKGRSKKTNLASRFSSRDNSTVWVENLEHIPIG